MIGLAGPLLLYVASSCWRKPAIKVAEMAKTDAPLVIELFYSPETKDEMLVVGDSHTYEQRIEWLDAHPDAMLIELSERVMTWQS